MRLGWAELRDFRNHALTRVEDLPAGLVVAVGPNGEGKTNLLEGLAFLFLRGSPRTSSSLPLVREGAAVVAARFIDYQRGVRDPRRITHHGPTGHHEHVAREHEHGIDGLAAEAGAEARA